MSTIKIYARQIAPEFQESPLDIFGIETDYINLTGNRDYNEHVSLLFERVRKALYSSAALDEWEDMQNGRGTYNTWADALDDLLTPQDRGPYTREERKTTWPDILRRYYNARSSEENDILCEALALVTGQPWEWRTLRGCCQGDWQKAFYPSLAWTRRMLEDFKTEYFNTGTEWIIHDEETPPESPEDITGYSVYCHGWNEEQHRAEIAAEAGTEPGNVILYAFDGWTRSASYKAV